MLSVKIDLLSGIGLAKPPALLHCLKSCSPNLNPKIEFRNPKQTNYDAYEFDASNFWSSQITPYLTSTTFYLGHTSDCSIKLPMTRSMLTLTHHFIQPMNLAWTDMWNEGPMVSTPSLQTSHCEPYCALQNRKRLCRVFIGNYVQRINPKSGFTWFEGVRGCFCILGASEEVSRS